MVDEIQKMRRSKGMYLVEETCNYYPCSWHQRKICTLHIEWCSTEDSSLMGCDSVSLGMGFQTFEKTIVLSWSGSSSPRKMLDSEGQGTEILQDVRIYWPIDTVSHLRRPE